MYYDPWAAALLITVVALPVLLVVFKDSTWDFLGAVRQGSGNVKAPLLTHRGLTVALTAVSFVLLVSLACFALSARPPTSSRRRPKA